MKTVEVKFLKTMKTVEVKFLNSYYTNAQQKTYDYLVEDDESVSTGDFAIVHNGSDLRVVQVINVSGKVSNKATKTLVAVINSETMAKYNEKCEAIRERKALFKRLDTILEQESELTKYKILAASNSEAAEILTKLNIL